MFPPLTHFTNTYCYYDALITKYSSAYLESLRLIIFEQSISYTLVFKPSRIVTYGKYMFKHNKNLFALW